ncbi:MAG TPA: CPBP family intramembrane glutamic endopeptidase [Thermoanaerobaculia bacterium]|nr:CPBP family intramembrane glutamic endopeptidase [Thermoanaerobaculia bacterium]
MQITPLVVVGILFVIFFLVVERFNLFSIDRFPSRLVKIVAWFWLGSFVLLVTSLVTSSASAPVQKKDLVNIPFWSLFSMHLILVIFLVGWWLLTQRPGIRAYLNIQPDQTFRAVMLGVAVGVGVWAVTIALAASAGVILTRLNLVPDDLQPSPMIPWMANLALWQKAVIIFSAMTVEEAFFRGWLQKRAGLVVSTIAFVIAHAGYGQPLMLIGITVVSLMIGITFYRTKNLIPCIIAHGVFDAIQLIVIVPLAVKFGGLG